MSVYISSVQALVQSSLVLSPVDLLHRHPEQSSRSELWVNGSEDPGLTGGGCAADRFSVLHTAAAKNNSRTWVVEHDIGRKQKKGSPRTYSVSLPIFLLAALFPPFFSTLFFFPSVIDTYESVCVQTRLVLSAVGSPRPPPSLFVLFFFCLFARSAGEGKRRRKKASVTAKPRTTIAGPWAAGQIHLG